MDEDIDLEGSKNIPADTNADVESDAKDPSENQEEEAPVERVFDITSDLNISPIDESKASESKNDQILKDMPIPKDQQLPKTPLQENLGNTKETPPQDSDDQLREAQAKKALDQLETAVQPESQTMSPPLQNNQPKITEQPKITTQTTTTTNPNTNKPVSIGEDGIPVVKSSADTEKFSKKALRTYEGDVAEFMSHRKTSVASIAIAENVKQEKGETINNDQTVIKEQKSNRNKKIIISILSIVLIGAGIGGAYYLYSQSAIAPKSVITTSSSANASLIPSNSIVNISIGSLTSSQIISRIQTEIAKSQPSNTIKEIVLTQNNNGKETRVISTAMIDIMDINAPDMLIRSLTPNWMLGEYSDANSNKDVFIVVTHNFFQNAFAGMLSWENVMADDLKQYFASTKTIENKNPITNTSTTTVTSSTTKSTNSATSSISTVSNIQTTTNIQSFPTLSGHFIDGIIKNKDVREFKTNTGNILFLYSFVDNTKLVITSKESTLTEIIKRLEQQAFVR
jgi:hypothetical protein